jgi:hypothetical protein
MIYGFLQGSKVGNGCLFLGVLDLLIDIGDFWIRKGYLII